jgi:hypothetical protein
MSLLLAGCGEKDEEQPEAIDAAPGPAESPSERKGEAPPPGDQPQGDAPTDPSGPAAERREAQRVVRAYVRALDARDGARVCRLLAPGVVENVRLPRERGSCPASLDASIGYRDPRGLPQYGGARVTQVVSTRVGPRSARVTATVVTDFADRDEPSIEDDIIYLDRARGGYLVAKPSTALYRAIGAEPPLRAVVPPG